MQIRKSCFLFFLLLMGAGQAFSQLSFDHLTVSNGLSQSTVLSIAKDSRGYLWFGTRDGLNRYNGKNIKVYRHDDQKNTSISADDYIYTIVKSKDNNLWIGTQRGLNYYQPKTDAFEKIYHNPKDPSSLSSNAVLSVCETKNGQVWFGTNQGLSMLANAKSRKFKNFKLKDGLAGNEIYCVFEDSKNNIWLGTTTGLTRIKPVGQNKYQFVNFFYKANDLNSLSGNSIKTIVEDKEGKIWIGTERNGISIYDPEQRTFSHIQQSSLAVHGLSNNFIRKIIISKEGKFWIATMNGLNIYDPNTRRFTVYKHDSENRKSLIDNSIKDLYEDEHGSVWIGTNFGGISVAHKNAVPFEVYKYSKYRNSISNDIISVIGGVDSQHILAGTEGSGIDYMNTQTGTFKNFSNQPNNPTSINSNNVKAIFKDQKGLLWIGLYEGGLEQFDLASGTFKHFKPNPKDSTSISHGYVSSIAQDQQGRLWIGTSSKGINLYHYDKQNFTKVNTKSEGLKISSDYIRVMLGDTKGNLWVGAADGLSILRKGKNRFERFYKRKDGLQSDYINCILEDNQHQIWIGSHRGGLAKYLPKQNKFVTYNTKNGLPSNNIAAMAQDDEGNLWISTDRGLSKFDVKRGNFKNYYVSDGLPSNEFSYNAAYKAPNGTLYFGSYNGLVAFKPQNISINQTAPKIVFTALRLFNKDVAVGGDDGLLEEDISFAPKITFSANQNIFTVDFVALNYIKPERNKYAYKLEGFEDNWNEVGIPSATYTNLPAGTYHLLVKGSNNDGYWNKTPARLEIKILPPLWQTWWAYVLYAIALALIWYYINRFLRRQERLETELYYEHLNYEQQQQLHQHKLEFFTRISHEIRTPLTLISAPIEKLIHLTQDNTLLNAPLKGIKSNTDRLLRLIKELLDFRKIETGNLQLKVAEVDLVAFGSAICQAFKSQTADKEINFRFDHPSQPVTAFIDASQMEKVLFNLLANALKYTPNHGSITLSLEELANHIQIKVHDTGTGISSEHLAHIFSDFYQIKGENAQTGWGIGLALVKDIVDMHRAQISVQSKVATADEEGYTEFRISMLKGSAHFSAQELAAASMTEHNEVTAMELPLAESNAVTTSVDDLPPHAKHILVVEDNDELREFIVQSLQHSYKIIGCANGLVGLEYAVENLPDLIISDVTMPIMNGNELCKQIKTEERTNHIPVIMLTAMAAHNHQIEGLEAGADVYITKPFSVQVLELNIRNILLSKEVLRAKLHKQLLLTPAKVEGKSPEEKFLARLMQIIENKMEDPDFNVTALVDDIGMSQTVLYKKIKALTDLSITDFIKSIRLKRAAQLLTAGQLSIAEVAYSVGFNDRKYFSKEFKKQFGVVPSDYKT